MNNKLIKITFLIASFVIAKSINIKAAGTITEKQVEQVINQAMKQAETQKEAPIIKVDGMKLPWWQRAKSHVRQYWEKYTIGSVVAGTLTTLAVFFIKEKRRADTAERQLKTVQGNLAQNKTAEGKIAELTAAKAEFEKQLNSEREQLKLARAKIKEISKISENNENAFLDAAELAQDEIFNNLRSFHIDKDKAREALEDLNKKQDKTSNDRIVIAAYKQYLAETEKEQN